MDENLNQEMGTEKIKNETKETINQVKENLKNVNVKEEAEATKGFVKEIFMNPLEKIHEIANDASNKFFKTAIVLVIIWTVAVMVSGLDVLFNEWGEFFENIIGFLKICLRPIVSVIVMSFVMFWLNAKEKKSLITYLTTITTAKLPIIAANVISLLTEIDSDISKITSKITTYAGLLSTVLLFFAIKYLSNESDDKNAFKKFVIVEAVWIAAYFVISFFGISMS